MKKNTEQIKLKDHSRFNRWIKDFDEKDKLLNSSVRKRKWLLIMTGVFSLFVLSFVLFPASQLETEKLDSSFSEPDISKPETSALSTFELPVDSFENHLKVIINENLPEKE